MQYWGACDWMVGVVHGGKDGYSDLHIILDLQPEIAEALIEVGPSHAPDLQNWNRAQKKLPTIERSMMTFAKGLFGKQLHWRWANLDTQLGNSRGVVSSGDGVVGTRRYLLEGKDAPAEGGQWKAVGVWKRGTQSRRRPGHGDESVEDFVGKYLTEDRTVFHDPIGPRDAEEARSELATHLMCKRAPRRPSRRAKGHSKT